MNELPVVVVFDKESFVLLADLISEEKNRISSDVMAQRLTIDELDDKTGRLDGLVKLLRALNEGAMTTLQLKRELNESGE